MLKWDFDSAQANISSQARPVRTPRVLILTSSLGGGHTRAAEAIRRALVNQLPRCQVRILDWWSLINPAVAASAQQTYLHLVQEHPHLYEEIYRCDLDTWNAMLLNGARPLPDSMARLIELVAARFGSEDLSIWRSGKYLTDRALFHLLHTALRETGSAFPLDTPLRKILINWTWSRLVRRLHRKIRQLAPSVIVSTQIAPAALVSCAKRLSGPQIPSIAVPTDFGVHRFWKQPGTDLYCLGHDDMRGAIPELQAEKIATTGLPLMDAFAHPTDRPTARRMLGLDARGHVITVLGGSLGLGVEAMSRRLLSIRSRPQLLVLPGRNAVASQALADFARRHPTRLRVFPWSERIDLFICAADLVVAKPGGLTVAEVLACGRPLLATRSLCGQESFNMKFIEKHGAGSAVGDANLPDLADALLCAPRRLAELSAHAWRAGRRHGAERIASLVASKAFA